MYYDKNGKEIKPGYIVRVSDAYFKNDNGLYFVEHAPGDPSWCGLNICLHKVKRNGELITGKYRTSFWPLKSYTNDRFKNATADEWNKSNATIEIIHSVPSCSVKAYFKEKADNLTYWINRYKWDFGENNTTVKSYTEQQIFFNSVANRL